MMENRWRKSKKVGLYERKRERVKEKLIKKAENRSI